MDNETTISCVQEILSKLDDEDVIALATTVSHGFLKNKLDSREDAIESIIKYSPDLKSILKRKVVTRELLFSYLHESKIPVSLPSSKQDLIELICGHMNLHVVSCEQVKHKIPPDECANVPDVNMLALKFSEWFYTMMNSNEPIGEEHFWTDSNLKLKLSSDDQNVIEEINHNPQEIIKILFRTKMEHSLYFNPNCLKDGVQGRVDPHGLVAVLVCGTLHSNSVCVGVFEQVFMLARDPFSSNNWKIKSTELNLRSKNNVQASPRLCDSNLMSDLLSLPSS
ncbi:hypothetical protein FQA39_LY06330 [Lamprigera yunnana]|nr:hypothetical protein FQA39_LY06330 [Lamprigera yunnana]